MVGVGCTGPGAAVGGTPVTVGAGFVAVGGTPVTVAGMAVAVGGTAVAVGGTLVAVAETGRSVELPGKVKEVISTRLEKPSPSESDDSIAASAAGLRPAEL